MAWHARSFRLVHPMLKRWLYVLVPLLVIVGLVIWRIQTKQKTEAGLAAGAGGGSAPAGGGKGGPGGGRMAPMVQIAKAHPAEIVTTIQAVGSLESPEKVLISPKTQGRIDFLQVREGDEVKDGQVLAQIDPTELRAAVVQQQANVAEARYRLAQAQIQQNPNTVSVSSQIRQQRATVVSANADLAQTRGNYDAQVASAQSSVTDATAKVASAQNGVANAEATLNQQKANQANAKAKYDRTFSLYKQGFVAAQDVDDAKTALQVAQSAVEVAQAQLSSAQHNVSSANAQLNSAKNQLSITKRKGLSDITSAQAKAAQAQAGLDVARANTASNPAYRANLDALRASVDAELASLVQAKTRLADLSLRSPINGVVTSRSADPGSLASVGQSLLTVQNIDWLYVTSSIPIDQSGQVHAGMRADIVLDAMPGKTYTGVVTNVNAAADPSSRQFSIRIKLPNPKHELRPGMFGHIGLVTGSVNAQIAVPREAIQTARDGTKNVVVIGEDLKAQIRTVALGAQNDSTVQVLNGVQNGEQVVVLSFSQLKDGQTVRLPGKPGAKQDQSGGKEGRSRAGSRPRRTGGDQP